jgi:hypothetical protein
LSASWSSGGMQRRRTNSRFDSAADRRVELRSRLSSPAFADGGAIPERYTADGHEHVRRRDSGAKGRNAPKEYSRPHRRGRRDAKMPLVKKGPARPTSWFMYGYPADVTELRKEFARGGGRGGGIHDLRGRARELSARGLLCLVRNPAAAAKGINTTIEVFALDTDDGPLGPSAADRDDQILGDDEARTCSPRGVAGRDVPGGASKLNFSSPGRRGGCGSASARWANIQSVRAAGTGQGPPQS